MRTSEDPFIQLPFESLCWGKRSLQHRAVLLPGRSFSTAFFNSHLSLLALAILRSSTDFAYLPRAPLRSAERIPGSILKVFAFSNACMILPVISSFLLSRGALPPRSAQSSRAKTAGSAGRPASLRLPPAFISRRVQIQCSDRECRIGTLISVHTAILH